MYVHLHTHSYYSLLEGLASPKDLVARAQEIGSPALGLTDKSAMYGGVEFYKACKDGGIKPVIGTEVYLATTSRFDHNPKTGTRRNNLILLAENQEGYKNLLQITTKSQTEGFYYKPRADKELLKEYSKGVIALSSDHWGEIGQAALMGRTDEEILALITEYQSIFGSENFFLELMDQPDITGRDTINETFIRLSKEHHIPLVVSNNVHYARKEDQEAHEVILCLQTGKDYEDPSRFTMRNGDYSMRDWDTMQSSFPQEQQAFQNTIEIANRCHYDFEFGVNLIPSFEIPKEETSFRDEELYFRKLCYLGLLERYPDVPLSEKDISVLVSKENYQPLETELKETSPEELKVFAEKSYSEEKKTLLNSLAPVHREIIDRLEYEMCVINEMGFCTYFLIVHDFIAWAKNEGIAVGPGRGSAAGALISYCLTITDIDPLTYSLLFERFLNPARVSMPDIDIDFEDARRGEVLDYVTEKFGRYNVCNVATFGTLKAKQAVKDVGRSLGVPYQEMDATAKLITEKLGTKLKDIMENNPDVKELIKNDSKMKRVFNLALKLEGVVRQLGVHACAVMISEKSLLEYTALQYPPKDKESLVSQYSMKPLESLGLLKMDFLGLRNLTVLQEALAIISKKRGIDIDISTIPLDDKKTFELFTRGETKGVFQFESEGMRKWLKELKPDNIEDIIAMASMYRPGPLAWIPVYVAKKHNQDITFPTEEGKKNFESLVALLDKYPEIKTILEPSNLIPIYQEQILQIAQKFSGFSLGEADLLRRAIGKKIAEELMAQKQKFIDGAVAMGKSKEDAIFLFERGIEPFADYGFNKSHAACYAVIAYRTAYLKANYPTEFMTGLLTTVEDATDKLIVQLQDCQDMGITILAPDINESDVHFTTIEEGKIRFGLNAIKGLGIEVAKEIVHTRETKGAFSSIEEVITKLPLSVLNKKTLEALAYGGAFDNLGIARDTIAKNTEALMQYAKSHHKQEESGQTDIFGTLMPNEEQKQITLTNDYPDSESVLLKKEKLALGFYVTSHPLQGLTPYLKKGAKQIRDLNDRMVNKKVTLVTMILSVKKLITKKGDMMAFVQLEDVTGEIGAVVFPKTYQDAVSHIVEDAVVKVRGKYELRNGEPQLLIEEITSLQLEKLIENAKETQLYDAKEERTFHSDSDNSEEVDSSCEIYEMPELVITLAHADVAAMTTIKSALNDAPKGNTRVVLHIAGRTITTPYMIAVSQQLQHKLHQLSTV